METERSVRMKKEYFKNKFPKEKRGWIKQGEQKTDEYSEAK